MTWYQVGDTVYSDRDRDEFGFADGRPVAVIDPDEETGLEVSRLWGLLPDKLVSIDQLQDALREFATPKPPKPEEPTGLGAVVESARGNRYVRAGDGWLPETVLGLFRSPIDWGDIAAVKVLSEGIVA